MTTRIEHPIVGVRRLVAHETILDDGEAIRQFGDTPRGRLILTASGHMSGFAAAPDRQPGLTDDRRAELHRSMIAYSGTYRIVGDQFETVGVPRTETRIFLIEPPAENWGIRGGQLASETELGFKIDV